MSQVEQLAQQVIGAVKGFVTQSMASMAKRLDGFEASLKSLPVPQKGEQGPPGERGERGEKGDMGPQGPQGDRGESVVGERGERGERGEPGQRGQTGESGQKGDSGGEGRPGDVGPAGERGADGIDGKNGLNAYEVAVSLGFDGDVHQWMKSLDGKPGENGTSVTAEQVLPTLRADLQKAIDALPIPKNGEPGKSVTIEDIRPLFDSAMAAWQLEFERRGMDTIQRTLDRIEKPKDGEPGRDCIDLATLDFQVEDDFRTWRVSAKAGDQLVERTLHVAVPVFQGVWKVGDQYQRGDIVGFGGSAFIAKRDTTAKPETDDSWQMFVKRGRDGKDATKVERADPGPIRLR